MAFVVASHRETLAEYFQLFSPSQRALIEVLDKGRLAAAAKRAGLKAAPTWEPMDEDELHRLAGELAFPVLVKPRAQILSAKGSKGVRVERPEDLLAAWREVRAAASVHRAAIAACPVLDRPVIQPYLQFSEGIYTVDGFMDADGNLLGALACVKGLQLPRRSGSGIYFEHAELDPEIRAGMERMCRAIGHVGVFDAEFALHGEDKLLIDLNPRFYNHMAYEADRGLPMAWLAYLSATRQLDVIPAALAEAQLAAPPEPGVYLHRLPMAVMLAAQALSGGMSRAERRQWRQTIAEKGVLTDAVSAAGDARPRYADLLQQFRHPRALIKKAAA
jgi:predicted ATP-grasp superfamily ATP-dependent carboligase